jgi:mono/diheme cytochrome c family protein
MTGGQRMEKLGFRAAGIALAAGMIGLGMMTPSTRLCAAEPQSFSEDVFPIFKGRCLSCHQPGAEGYEKSGLDLTTYEGLMKGTKFGAMVVPRDPEGSNLMWLLDWRASPELRMPHGKKKLSTCDRNAIRAWIREGAKNN